MSAKNLYTIASPIYRKTVENQGCSMNLDGIEPVEGYMVSIAGREQKINALAFNDAHVDSFIRANLDKLYLRSFFIGTWMHEDQVVIDIYMNVLYDLDYAKQIAVDNGQIAIWDVLNKKEIEL
jgi:hypothetical protein